MTLHEIIKIVLEEVGRALTSEEIAGFINKKDLYQRKDGSPVSSNQVNARVSNYPDIFFNRKGRIYLIKEDDRARTYRLFREHITRQINYLYNIGDVNQMDKFIEILNELAHKDLNEYAKLNDISLPASFKPEIPDTRYQDKFHIIYQTCNWFLSQYAKQGVLKEKWADFLCELNCFRNTDTTVYVESGLYSHFLLKLPFGTSSKFYVQNLHGVNRRHDYQVDEVNRKIFEVVNLNSTTIGKPENKNKIGIFIPPLGPLNSVKLEEQLHTLLTEIKTAKIGLDKAFLLMPSGFLNSRSNKVKILRKELVESGNLEKVIGIGTILEHSAIHLSLLMFDFNKDNSQIFFIDSNQLLTTSPDLSKIVNSEILIKEASSNIPVEQVVDGGYNLSPFFYTTDIQEISKNNDGILTTLSDLILEGKRGTVLRNRNKLYDGGEYKFIRVPDLNNDRLYFNAPDSILGIDADVLPDRSLIKNYGIVLSAFNNIIKANILKGQEKYLIDQNLIWLNIDNDKILEEFLLLEFKKEYVRKQIESYSIGMAMPRLSYADLKELKIRVPSLNTQKEKVIALLKRDEKTDSANDLNELEVDFIKTLKHTIKQPTSTLLNDFSILRDYLLNRAKHEKGIKITDSLVKVFEEDTEEFAQKFKLDSTLERIERSIDSIDYIVDQAIQLISLNQIEKREIKLKDWLKKFTSEYDQIKLNIVGPNLNVFVDPKQLKIMIDNFIQNALRHGFIDAYESNSEVSIEIEDQNQLAFNLFIRNNGKPLPPEFTVEDFLAKGASTKAEVGSGFGGFLIGKIVSNHGGEVNLGNKDNLNAQPYNVEFIISLPK